MNGQSALEGRCFPIRFDTMASRILFCPAVPVHQQARCERECITSLSKLQANSFSTPKRQTQRCARGTRLIISAAKKVLVPVANGSEEMEAVLRDLALPLRYCMVLWSHKANA